MSGPNECLHVLRLPREPFVRHSEDLLQRLLAPAPTACKRVLEIGCGPCSPLLPMLRRVWPELQLYQIDAQADVVAEAARHNPWGRVEQMLASDMSRIPARSQELVVAMSVFDQNSLPIGIAAAREIHRVLVDGGLVVYLHNEELNLPATAASMLADPIQPRLLLPNDRWQPGGDYEYCSADMRDVQNVWRPDLYGLTPLLHYLHSVLPQLFGNLRAQPSDGKVSVPFLRDCTPAMMDAIRQGVSFLRNELKVPLTDHRTTDMLRGLVEQRLFSPSHGFQTLRAGVFELRCCVGWREVFSQPPPFMHFVRGISRFGCATADPPQPVPEFDQSLNTNPQRQEGEVLLIAYQYGMVARKV